MVHLGVGGITLARRVGTMGEEQMSLPKLWIRLSGPKVEGNRVSAKLLGNYLVYTQNLVRHVGESIGTIPKPGRPRRRQILSDFELQFMEFKRGSVQICLSAPPREARLDRSRPVQKTLEKVIETFQEVKDPREADGLAKFQETHPDPEKRIQILRSLKGVWPRRGLEANYEVIREEEVIQEAELTPIYYERIPKWLGAELEVECQPMIGVITRAKLDGRTQYFSLLDEENVPLKCEFKQGERPDLEQIAVEFLKQPIRFIGSIERKTKKLLELDNIEPIYHLTMTPERYSILQHPVVLDLSFEDGVYVARNKNLELIIISEKIHEFYTQFELEMEALIALYLHEEDTALAKRAQQLKKNLKAVLTPDTQGESYEFKVL